MPSLLELRVRREIAISVLSVAVSCPVDAADDVAVSVVASCEAMLKEYCLGAHGFRIAEPGVFLQALPRRDVHAMGGQSKRRFSRWPAERSPTPPTRASRVRCSACSRNARDGHSEPQGQNARVEGRGGNS
jgi:hypothetical protein